MLAMKKIQGVSMVELMISLAAGLVLMTASISLVAAIIKNSNRTLELARFNHDLQASLDRMAMDIRRAGYWGDALNDVGTGTNTNPFMQSGTDLTVNAGQDCVLFSYDLNGDGTLPAVNAAGGDKRFGYRLMNNKIQMRPNNAAFDCSAAANSWSDLTDANITSLVITKTENVIDLDGAGPGSSTITARNVDISITAALPSDPTITRTLTQQVKVRNDKFTP